MLMLLAVSAAPAHAAVPLVHVPPEQADSDEPLAIVVSCDDAQALDGVELRYRQIGRDRWRSLAFERAVDGDFIATIPADEVRFPGLEYHISEGSESRFADPLDPQRVQVNGTRRERDTRRDLERSGGQRSTAHAGFDYVDLGSNTPESDLFWVSEADFTYRPFTEVHALRVGVQRMRGEAEGPDEEVGADLGYGDLEVSPVDALGLSGRLVLGVTAEGFTAGGGGRIRIGAEPGTRVTFQLSSVINVGEEYDLTLHWATVPKVPMSASVIVGTWPKLADQYVQARYQAIFGIGSHADLALRVGYQARSSDAGGFGGGAGLSWSY